MPIYIHTTAGANYEVEDVTQVEQWVRERRVSVNDQIFDPAVGRWLPIQEALPWPPPASSSGRRLAILLGLLFVVVIVGPVATRIVVNAALDRNAVSQPRAQVVPASERRRVLPQPAQKAVAMTTAQAAATKWETAPMSAPKRHAPTESLALLSDVLSKDGVKLVKSYRWESGFGYVYFEPSLWNSFSSSQQRQLCDGIAAMNIWEASGMITVRLFVGSTKVGTVKKSWGGGWTFDPSLRALE